MDAPPLEADTSVTPQDRASQEPAPTSQDRSSSVLPVAQDTTPAREDATPSQPTPQLPQPPNAATAPIIPFAIPQSAGMTGLQQPEDQPRTLTATRMTTHTDVLAAAAMSAQIPRESNSRAETASGQRRPGDMPAHMVEGFRRFKAQQMAAGGQTKDQQIAGGGAGGGNIGGGKTTGGLQSLSRSAYEADKAASRALEEDDEDEDEDDGVTKVKVEPGTGKPAQTTKPAKAAASGPKPPTAKSKKTTTGPSSSPAPKIKTEQELDKDAKHHRNRTMNRLAKDLPKRQRLLVQHKTPTKTGGGRDDPRAGNQALIQLHDAQRFVGQILDAEEDAVDAFDKLKDLFDLDLSVKKGRPPLKTLVKYRSILIDFIRDQGYAVPELFDMLYDDGERPLPQVVPWPEDFSLRNKIATLSADTAKTADNSLVRPNAVKKTTSTGRGRKARTETGQSAQAPVKNEPNDQDKSNETETFVGPEETSLVHSTLRAQDGQDFPEDMVDAAKRFVRYFKTDPNGLEACMIKHNLSLTQTFGAKDDHSKTAARKPPPETLTPKDPPETAQVSAEDQEKIGEELQNLGPFLAEEAMKMVDQGVLKRPLSSPKASSETKRHRGPAKEDASETKASDESRQLWEDQMFAAYLAQRGDDKEAAPEDDQSRGKDDHGGGEDEAKGDDHMK